MRVDDHVRKAERLSDSADRLDASGEFDASVWLNMHAATQWVNVLLHAKGVTRATPWYPSNNVGLYVLPDGDAGWREEPREPGDILHAAKPNLAYPDDPGLRGVLDELRSIEAFIPSHIRGASDCASTEARAAGTARKNIEAAARLLISARDDKGRA